MSAGVRAMAAMRWKLAIVRFASVAIGLLLAGGLELGRVARAEGTVLLQEAGELAEGDRTIEDDGRFLDFVDISFRQ